MAGIRALAILLSSTWIVACSSDSSKEGSEPVRDGGAQSRDTGPVDENGGRDRRPDSCFAACQNSSFTCRSKVGSTTVTKGNLQLNDRGCIGTLTDATEETELELRLVCLETEVCVGSTCSDGLFSATSFSYTPSGGSELVCVRD